jgi:FeS assembly SUF system protein
MENYEVTSGALEMKIIDALRTVYDPEIPVNIYELGLVYEVHVDDEFNATVKMTLTSPSCPAAEMLPGEVESKIRTIEGLNSFHLQVVWDPPWTPELMSEAAKLELGMM